MNDSIPRKQGRCRDLVADAVPTAQVTVRARGQMPGWQILVAWTDGATIDEVAAHLAGSGIGSWSQAGGRTQCVRPPVELTWLPDGVFVPVTVLLDRSTSAVARAAERLRAHLAQRGLNCDPAVQETAVVLLADIGEANPNVGVDAATCEHVLRTAMLVHQHPRRT